MKKVWLFYSLTFILILLTANTYGVTEWTVTTQTEWNAGTYWGTQGYRVPGDISPGVPETDPGITAYWHFNNTSGPVVDASAYGNDGTAFNGVSRGQTGARGSYSFRFDGIDDYVLVPDDLSLDNANKMTIEFWVYPRLIGCIPQPIISKRESLNVACSYTIFLGVDGKLYVDINSDDNRFATNTVFAEDRCYYVAVVFDGTRPSAQRVKVYVDGILDITAPEASTVICPCASDLHFGAFDLYDPNHFDGNLDEVIIYKRVLGADEIRAHYDLPEYTSDDHDFGAPGVEWDSFFVNLSKTYPNDSVWAIVSVSDDNFATVKDYALFRLINGHNAFSLHSLDKARYARVFFSFVLSHPCDYSLTLNNPIISDFTVLPVSSDLQVISIYSDLPNAGFYPCDYEADWRQEHNVYVELANLGPHAIDSLFMYLNSFHACGSRIEFEYIPHIGVGEIITVVFTISEPSCTGMDSMFVDFGMVARGYNHPRVDQLFGDNDLIICVEQEAHLEILATYVNPATAPYAPNVTKGQDFQIIVVVHNSGEANIAMYRILLESFSAYGISSTILNPIIPVFNLDGGETDTLIYFIIADDETGGTTGDDELFEATVWRSRAENTDLPVDSIYYIDNWEFIDIQNPPDLWIADIYAQGGLPGYMTWLNSWNFVNVDVVISSAAGDYATADMFDVYSSVLTIWASEVLGIGGVNAPSSVFPVLHAGESDTMTFTLWAIGPTEQTLVDVTDTTHYHDGNWASQVEPAASPIFNTFEDVFNIDVIAPNTEILYPIAGMPWDCDTIKIAATDNYSGVDSVRIAIINTAGQYWDGVCCWGWTPVYFYAVYNWIHGYWVAIIGGCPTGNFNIYSFGVDVAGNVEESPYRVPQGDFHWLHIVEIHSDLPANYEMVNPPRWDYEADWGQAHICSVLIYNANSVACFDVEINLYSIWMNTTIATPFVFPVIAPGAAEWAYFPVTEVPSSVLDSVYAHITGGIDGEFNTVVGEQVTDNDLLILVEEPSLLRMLECYVDYIEAPVRNGINRVFVTRGQDFTVHTSFDNFGIDPFHPGEDIVDSLVMRLVSRGPWCTSTIVPAGPLTYYDVDGTVFRNFTVTANSWCVGNLGTQDERLVVELLYAKENNHPMGVCNTVYIDTLEWLGIQYPPTLVIADIYTDKTWLNSWNTVYVYVVLWNTCGDYATADMLTSYNHSLVLYEPDTTLIYGVAGLVDPVFIARDMIPTCATDTLIYAITEAGPSYEGWVGVEDTSYFHDKNWPAQVFPVTAPVVDLFKSPVFGIDVTDPITDIFYPMDDKYGTFPATCSIWTWDAVSGVDPANVYYAIKDPAGRYWNGWTWTWGVDWHIPVLDIPNNVWHFNFPPPPMNGKFLVRAFCWDIAGNMGSEDSLWFIFDDCPPETRIIYPNPGFYSYDGECPEYHWDGTIKVVAHDTACGTNDVAGIKAVWVGIRDTLSGKFWTGSGWSAHVWPWRATTRVGLTDTFIYAGFNDYTHNRVLSIFSYGRDSVDNFGGEDTTEYVIFDVTDPWTYFNYPHCSESNTLWGPELACDHSGWIGNINGTTFDSITRVDSVKIQIWDEYADEYWTGFGWSRDEYWVRADWNYAPGEAVTYFYALPWAYLFTPDRSSLFRVRARGIDDVCNMEPYLPPTPDVCNEIFFYYDNDPPVLDDRMPASGATYFPGALWTRDTLKIYARDDANVPHDWVDSVVIVISRYSDDFYWNHDLSIWQAAPFRIQCAMLIPDSIWFYTHDFVFDDEEDYQIRAYAYDHVCNHKTIWYAFTISSAVYELRAHSAPSVITVGETFAVTCSVFNVDGFDPTFYGPVELEAHPTDLGVTFLGGPHYIIGGLGHFVVQCDNPMVDLMIHVRTIYPSPDTLNAWSVPPVQVQGIFDSTIEILDLYDNPDDQGDTLILIHDRMGNDPFHADPDTTDWILTFYKYFRFDGIWVEIDSQSPADAGSLKVVTNGSFAAHCFMVMGVVFNPLMGEDTVYSNIMCAAPIDNVTPMAVFDLDIFYVAGDIELIWPEVRLGIDGSPEIDPSLNIMYEIYRFTYPYDTPIAPYATTFDTFWFDFLAAGDLWNNYYYYVVAVDFSGNRSDISNRVGEINYEISPGWSALGIPFGIDAITQCDDFETFLGYANINSIARYSGSRTWLQWVAAIPGFNNFGLDPEREDLVVNTVFDDIVTVCGDVPESLDVVFGLNFPDDWNGVLLPLHKPQGLASDFLSDVPNCTGVAHMLPGGSWNQLLVTPLGDTLFNFATYPGYPYMVWVETAGVWPVYPIFRGKANDVPPERGELEYNMPALIYGQLENADGSIPENVTFRAYIKDRPDEVLKETSVGCGTQKGYFVIQLGNFTTKWEAGDVVHIEITSSNSNETVTLETKLDMSVVRRIGKVSFSGYAVNVPDKYILHQNYPNPFNPTTVIEYDVPENAKVTLKIYNILGGEVKTLVDSERNHGYHKVIWDGTDDKNDPVPGGVYFYKMTSNSFSNTKKLMFVK